MEEVMSDSDAAAIYREVTALPVARANSSGRGREPSRAPRVILQRPILPEVVTQIIPVNLVEEDRLNTVGLDVSTASID
jgi:hypothetical protein